MEKDTLFRFLYVILIGGLAFLFPGGKVKDENKKGVYTSMTLVSRCVEETAANPSGHPSADSLMQKGPIYRAENGKRVRRQPTSTPGNMTAVVILTSLGTWSLPQMTQKFYAIKNEAAIVKRSANLSFPYTYII